ncbi:conserved exported hypothetical protein [Verrucomicrobia bacterium]|nr:conserved exported hypothetical protein [Verrucomicrobiota bacterium]
MKRIILLVAGASALVLSTALLRAEIKIVVEHNDNEHAAAGFKFSTVPAPAKDHAAMKAKFVIVDGVRDDNAAGLEALHDGKLPSEEDDPEANFFFTEGTDGGRILIDLGDPRDLKQVNSYSWHPNTRGPQVYKLYASDGKPDGFNAQPRKATDPVTCGWKLLGQVDTRPKEGQGGGQYGVSISESDGTLGKFRYLLFDISRTETADDLGNTFYSEIDVIDANAAPTAAGAPASGPAFSIRSPDGKYALTIDTSGAPDLTEWAEHTLAPVLAEWYAKLVAMLPSDGYEAPSQVSFILKPGRGVAGTSGNQITANANWLKGQLGGQAIGSLIHEEVHVVQNYGDRHHNPGWLVEGIADYIRWYKYEPQSHGAEITKRGLARARYNASYRVTANFLNWVTEKYDQNIVREVNAALRRGEYEEALWKQHTGHTVQELGDEWKAGLEKALGDTSSTAGTPVAPSTAPVRVEKESGGDSAAAQEGNINTLTEQEKAAGWKLLFNGKDFTGWHNFRRPDVRPGWEVKDGALVCADPHDAGDIVTSDQFDWFELQLDYNISVAGNSGIMYHVTDAGRAVWATGPEFQLEDNKEAADPVRCGWLYALYQPPDDPKTGKPLDATKPVGEWNHVRLLISPEKCEHDINGVKYFEYVLGSEDFKARVARSKFATMPGFAKSNSGYIALQGDHGSVSFRNIKIRPIAAKP